MRRTVLGGGFGLAWFLARLPNVENGKGKRVVAVSQSLPTSPHGEFFSRYASVFLYFYSRALSFPGISDRLHEQAGGLKL